MAKKQAARMKTVKKSAGDQKAKAQRVAEKARPGMRVVEAEPASDEICTAPDATVPEVEHVRAKYGAAAVAEEPQKALEMVRMEPKRGVDARAGRNMQAVVVDPESEEVVGEQG